MEVSEFCFNLPDERIARYPQKRRTDSRLLLVDGGSDTFHDHTFIEFPQQLRRGDLLVLNDTRVVPARLIAYKTTGGRVELLLERALGEHCMLMHASVNRPLKQNTVLHLGTDISLQVEGRLDGLYRIQILSPLNVEGLLDRYGSIPLPPYLKRDPIAADLHRYQTVYARHRGAVAAPTAGLHFTREMLDQIQSTGIELAAVTLHVGSGTFQPIRTPTLEEHSMPEERVRVPQQTVDAVLAARARGARVIAVGTTTVRSLEACCASGSPTALNANTSLFIYPGYEFRCVDAMLTNFHLPQSTLLMLVCAFAGTNTALAAYQHAVATGYRFYSYGDAMFVTRKAT